MSKPMSWLVGQRKGGAVFKYLWMAWTTPAMFRSGPQQFAIGTFCFVVFFLLVVACACWIVTQDEKRVAKLKAEKKTQREARLKGKW
jgi:hypothetical protein